MTEQQYAKLKFVYDEKNLILYRKTANGLRIVKADRVEWGFRGNETRSKYRAHVIHLLKHGRWPAK